MRNIKVDGNRMRKRDIEVSRVMREKEMKKQRERTSERKRDRGEKGRGIRRRTRERD